MEEWNATLTGDCLWTNRMVGEVFPGAMTPSTWSVWQDFFAKLSLGDQPSIERVAGRPYLNYSLTYSFIYKLTRSHERTMSVIKDSVGAPPASVAIPTYPISWRVILFQILPQEARNQAKKAKLGRAAPQFLAMVRDRCWELGGRIGDAQAEALIALWKDELRPLWNEIHFLQDKLNEDLNLTTRTLKKELTRLLGEDDTNAVLTTISSTGELASVGPLVGLAQLSRGELSREEYLRRYGHRGTYENELAEPRQDQDPGWIDRQLAGLRQSPADVAALLSRRDAEMASVLHDVKRKLPPSKARVIERRVHDIVETNTRREATRSELTRVVSVIRAWFLRAAALTGLGDDVFFLQIGEVVDVLSGDRSAVAHIRARHEAYEKYRALPPLPTWICGRFDPFAWAADPNRRRDVFDTHLPAHGAEPRAPEPHAVAVIHGQPGSAGRAEGLVRRIDSPDEGSQLRPGEILVTSTTNVGWTPLFPRAAAVVTDIGGSLSHAAIVARELGIPAVVGCDDATIRLHTGDRVVVDGRQGTIAIVAHAG